MRSTRVLVIPVILFFLIPLSSSLSYAANSDNVTWELPPVQWTKDLDSGYVSTAPVIFDDVMFVKVGGKSGQGGASWDDGKGPGIYAFDTFSGEQLWRYEHNQSQSGFETSPPLYIHQYGILVNGWTSGIITANDAQTGELIWQHQTEKISWGITGKAISLIGESSSNDTIHFAFETGVLGLSPNGTVLFEHPFPNNATGYRNGVGLVLIGYNKSQVFNPQGGLIFAAGDETGGFHAWGLEGNNFTSWHLDELLPGSSWKVRTPPFLTFPRNESDDIGLGLVIQGTTGGKIINLDYSDNGGFEIKNMKSIGVAPAIPLILPDGLVITGDLSSVLAHCSFNSSSCDNSTFIAEGPVSGEITSLFGNYNSGGMPFSIAHNVVDGYWTGHLIWWDGTQLVSSLQWDWHPENSGWITAGVGGTSEVMAAANDASWLEVRFENQNDNTNYDSVDQQEEIVDFVDVNSTVTGLPMFSELVIVVMLMISLGALFVGSIPAKKAGSIGILLVFLLLLPTLNIAWVSSINNEDNDQEVESSQFPEQYLDTQVVCFEFPDDLWDEEVGLSIFLDASGVEIERFQGNLSRTCVGGLQGHENIHTASMEAAFSAGYNYTWSQQPLGMFVEDIGVATAGDGDRWWLYWVDGQHGALAADLQPLTNGSVVEWRFL